MTSKRKTPPLKVVHPHCAGIDVGKSESFVAVLADDGQEIVRRFEAFTDALEALAGWLRDHAVEQVAMEATGVYWIPLFEVLDRAGFEVRLVNPRATKRPDGRKTDVLDCQWIRSLMSMGLLDGAHRPADEVCALRSYVRQRDRLLRGRARQIQHMQKALVQMNVQLENVLSDIVGKTGMAILRAIVAGERDPQVLASHRDGRVKATEETLRRSLHGNWRDEHLHELAVALRLYDALQAEIDELEARIAAELETLAADPSFQHGEEPSAEGSESDVKAPAERSESDLKAPARRRSERLRQLALWHTLGVDLTAIPGVGIETALLVMSEIGGDVSQFPTAAHFCSWLALAPNNRISGGKLLGRSPMSRSNKLGQAFRQAAVTVRRSETWLGAQHRRRLARMEKAKAVKATAHEIARLVYAMMSKGTEFVERTMEVHEHAHRERKLFNLARQAGKLGLALLDPQTHELLAA